MLVNVTDAIYFKHISLHTAATRALMYVDIAARHKESFLHIKNIKAF